MTLNINQYQIILDTVKHRGFGLLRPDQQGSYYQWMICFWWCVAIRIQRKKMAAYYE
jgi:hypothetical protein